MKNSLQNGHKRANGSRQCVKYIPRYRPAYLKTVLRYTGEMSEQWRSNLERMYKMLSTINFGEFMLSRSGDIGPRNLRNSLQNDGWRANGSSQWRQIWYLSIFRRALPLVQIWGDLSSYGVLTLKPSRRRRRSTRTIPQTPSPTRLGSGVKHKKTDKVH